MYLHSWLQRAKFVLIGTILALALSHGLVVAQTESDEFTFNEDQVKYECEKFYKICPDNYQAEIGKVFPYPNLLIECAVCENYELSDPTLDEYIKYSNNDFNADYKFDDKGANSEKDLVDAAKRRAEGNNSTNNLDVVPEDEPSSYAYYIEQRQQIGDRPNSSEFFNVNNFDPNNPGNSTGLLAEGQNSFFNGGSGNPVLDFIVRVVEFLISMIGLATLVVVVIGAYLLLTAAGDDEQLGKGKDVIKFGLLGMVIAIFAYSIVTFVQAVIY